jgi:RNA chaperone Hfq
MTFELITGKILVGKLKRFDRFAVVVETEKEEILVYKHAIATITDSGPGDKP